MANLSGAGKSGVRALIIIAVAVGTVASEMFRFPEFVAIEAGEAGLVGGGWITDNGGPRPTVLTTEACVHRGRDLRQLLVRYGSAEVNRRTHSLAVDRMVEHPPGPLVTLGTFGRFHRPSEEPLSSTYNGTLVLCWHRKWDGVPQKTVLLVPRDQEASVGTLVSELLCDREYLLEGALVLRNMVPRAMLTVRPDAANPCGSSLHAVELADPARMKLALDAPLVEPVNPDDGTSSFAEPNSAFGYVVYVIFLGYCILYTVLYFIFALGKTNPSTNL